MTAPVVLERCGPERRADYLRLLGDAWGPAGLDGSEYDWWFDGNPSGSLRSVAVRDGEVVAVAGHTLARIATGDRTVLAQYSVHAVTVPSARGLGLFRALERRHEEEGAALGSVGVLAFASAPTRPLFLGPLGWTAIDRRRVWARPLRGIGARLVPRWRGPERVLPAGVRRVARFDQGADALYAALAPGLHTHVVRDRRYLNWRYAASPRDYRLLRSEDGIAVVGRRLHRGARVALVLELLAPAAGVDELLRACVAAAGDAEALLVVPSPVVPGRVLAQHAFTGTPVTLDFMGKPFGDGLPLHGRDWSISLGDTDFF